MSLQQIEQTEEELAQLMKEDPRTWARRYLEIRSEIQTLVLVNTLLCDKVDQIMGIEKKVH